MAPFKRRKTINQRVAELTPGKAIRQTVTIGGKRTVVTQRMTAAGNVITTTKQAKALEVDLQAAQVQALRNHPAYGIRFALAGDMNAGERGGKAAEDALRSGMTAGEPDLRLYFDRGRLVLVENKEESYHLSDDQVARHKLLRALGYEVVTIYAATEDLAVRDVLDIVRQMLDCAL